MKKHIILPITLAAMMILGGCAKGSSQGQNTNTGSDTTDTGAGGGGSSEVAVNSVSITNKDALTAEWFAGEAVRKVAVAADPEIEDINDLLDSGALTITSSNAEVVAVNRLMLSPVAAGTATITVNYGGKSDSVEITVSAIRTAKDKYGTVHEGTAEDPFDNADAVKAAPLAVEAVDTTVYYIKGIVKEFYHAVGSRTDGYVSFYIEDSEGKKGFEAYKILKEDGSSLTDDEIWIGAEVVVKGKLTVYSGQAETDTGVWVENTGNGAAKPQPKQDINATVDEILAFKDGMENGESKYDTYHVTGYITDITTAYDASYGNLSFNMASEKGGANKLLAYRCKATADQAAKLLVGAQVKVKGTAKRYNDTMQLDAGCSLEEILAEADPSDNPSGGETEKKPVREAAVVETPVAGTEYLVGAWQQTVAKQLLLTGEVSGNYLTTTEDKASGVKVVVEEVEGGYNLKIKDGQYINIALQDGQTSKWKPVLADTADTVYTWNASAKTFFTTNNSTEVYLGCYSSYETIGVSKTSYLLNSDGTLKSGQNPLHLYLESSIGADDVYADDTAGGDTGDDTPAAPANAQTVKIDFTALEQGTMPLKADVTAGTAVDCTISDVACQFLNAYYSPSGTTSAGVAYASYLMMNSKGFGGAAAVYNTAAFPGTIYSVKVNPHTSCSTSAAWIVSIGGEASTGAATEGTTGTGKDSVTAVASVDSGYKYFNITSSSTKYNAQIGSIEIVYVPAA